MKRLIVNADDFGLSPGVDRGIIECMAAGVVTSTSVLVWEPAPPPIPDAIRGRCGVHLRLTDGKAVFKPAAFGPHPDIRDVRDEWLTQIGYFASACPNVTHIDTHHHQHGKLEFGILYRDLARQIMRDDGGDCAAIGLSPEQTVGLRAAGVPCPDYVERRWSAEHPLPWLLSEDFAQHETVWLMCHPGYVDAVLVMRSSMAARREAELRYLMSAEFHRFLHDEGVTLVGAADLVARK